LDRLTWITGGGHGFENDANEFGPVAAMMRPLQKHLEEIELIPAGREQEPVLANLLELYIHDFSEFHDCEMDVDGRFGYAGLALYWSEADRYAFLVRVAGKLAGLVLVRRGTNVSGDETVWDMAEFFVLRGYRRYGIGTSVAHMVWRHFPGRWQVRVMGANVSAQRFWAHATATLIGERVDPVRVELGGGWWEVFSFEAGILG
jgi:predicted acetyltransferase